jgi:ATP-dependent Clp protease, protease subunit
MKLAYRTAKNAEAVSQFWGKSLDKADWFKVQAVSDEETEILIYDVIGWPYNDATELVRSIAGMKGKNITARINSPGGDAFDGVAIFNAFKAHGNVTTRVEGLAASIASVIALGGNEVQAYSNTMYMIHNAWIWAAGNQYDLREVADILEKIDGQMVDIYAANSKTGKREIAQMMKDETWMTAKEAKEKGFIDTVLDGKSAKAQFDLSMFANTPDEFLGQDREYTEREKERALRDVGFSQREAKAILAGRWKAEAVEEISAAERLIATIRRN